MASEKLEAWSKDQIKNSFKVVHEDQFCYPLQFIGGFDISFVDQSEEIEEFEAIGAFVVLEYESMKLLYSDCVEMKTNTPYISGYLGYREEPFVKVLLKKLLTISPELLPQVLLIDGCGIYHPRRFGSASQIGVNLDIPTIGVSKSFLKLDGIEEKDFIVEGTSIVTKPFESPVIISDGFQIATALYTGKSKHPSCFVSVGHRISLSTATEIVKKCTINKIPEPIRLADLISRNRIRMKNSLFCLAELNKVHLY